MLRHEWIGAQENQPLGILPVPRQVGQVSPECPFMLSYGGKCLRVLTFSIQSEFSVVLLLSPGKPMTQRPNHLHMSCVLPKAGLSCDLWHHTCSQTFKRPIKGCNCVTRLNASIRRVHRVGVTLHYECSAPGKILWHSWFDVTTEFHRGNIQTLILFFFF